MRGYSIGDVSAASGVKVTTIRFYEQRGLMAKPNRTESGRRQYMQGDITRLQFIRHARDLGFDLDAISQLLDLSDLPDHDCATANRIARAQLTAVDQRIAQLGALRSELARMILACQGGTVAECRVIQSLGDHALCAHDHPRAG